MIFNCGLTWDEIKRRRGEWHDFFPLWPRTIRIDNGHLVCAWLQTIERRSYYYSGWGESWWENEYRLKRTEPQHGEGK